MTVKGPENRLLMVMETVVLAVVSFFYWYFKMVLICLGIRILIKKVRKMGKLKKVCIFANRITKN